MTINLSGGDVDGNGREMYQRRLGRENLQLWHAIANAATAPAPIGMAAPTVLGTATARTIATTSVATRQSRLGYVSAATAAAFAGHFATQAPFTIGTGAGVGGFLYICRFVPSDAATVSGARMFVGVSSSVATPTNVEPNTLTNCVGVAQLSTGTNLQIVYGGSAAQTAIDLGSNFSGAGLSADAYELTLYADSRTQTVQYWVAKLGTAFIATGTLSGTVGTVVPAATTLLAHRAWRTNNATLAAVGLDITLFSVSFNR
jgi:hypothetical protein